MKGGVITIGNEILKGRTVNTNAAEIGRVMYFSGYEVFRGIVVPDDPQEIAYAFRECLNVCDVIISSGGLGPTFDDMTIPAFAKAFNLDLKLDDFYYNRIKESFSRLGLPMTEERKKMAMIPENSTPIENNVGSAPGIECTIQGKRVFILPGVPAEMRSMLKVIGKKIKLSDSFYSEKSIVVKGIYESTISPLVKRIMREHGNDVYIKTHPGMENGVSVIEIEVSAKSKREDEAEKNAENVLKEIEEECRKLSNP